LSTATEIKDQLLLADVGVRAQGADPIKESRAGTSKILWMIRWFVLQLPFWSEWDMIGQAWSVGPSSMALVAGWSYLEIFYAIR
jgi:hypothetical protein